MADDTASIGVKMETSDIERGIQSLETLAQQGPKVEKSMQGVEGAAAKTSKSLKGIGEDAGKSLEELSNKAPKAGNALDGVEKNATKAKKGLKDLGEGAGKGLEDVGRTAPKAADSLGRVVNSAEEAKKAMAAMNASIAGLNGFSASTSKAASDMLSFGAGAKSAQQMLKEMQAQIAATNQSVAQMGSVFASTVSALQAAAKAQADAAKNAADMGQAFKLAGDQMRSYGATAQQAAAMSKDGAQGIKSMADAGNGLGVNIGMAVRGVQALLAMQVVGWAKESATALYQASSAAERLRIGLDFASARGSADEIAYLRRATYDLGLSFASTATAYQQFAAAARGTSLEGEKARSVFESVAKASAVMGLDAEKTSGVLLALQQMISKGTVQSEELRGQLGERLPGAFQTAARAMGVTTAELGKMLEMGQVVAEDFLPKFANELNRSLGDAAEKAANRLDASVNRANDAWDRLKQNVGDSGVSKFWAGQLDVLSDGMANFNSSIEMARLSGAGFFGQLKAGAGAALEFINPLNAVSYAALETGNKLKEAEKRLQDLKDAGAQQGSNLMLREAFNHAQRLVDKLREAKRAQDALAVVNAPPVGGDPYNDGSLYGAYKESLAEQIASEKTLQEMRMRTAGINQQYFKDMSALMKARDLWSPIDPNAAGTLSPEAYVREMSNLATRTYDSSAAGKDAKKGERDAKAAARLGERLDAAATQKSLAQIKASFDDLTTVYSGSEAIMEAARRTGAFSEKEYYSAKIAFVNLNIDAKKRELEQENKVLEAQKATGVKDIERDKKIEENKARINRLTQEGAMRTEALTNEANAAINAQAASLDAARRAAQDYLDTMQRGFDRSALAVGWGSERRNVEAGRQQIEDRYADQRRELANQRAKAEFDANGKLNDEQRKMYDDRLAIINTYESKALEAYQDGVARRLAAEGDWTKGANRAWEDYASSAANVAQMSFDTFSRAFSSMEDAMVSFTTTGKLDFKSLANSVIADIMRMQIRAQMSGLFGNLLGSFGIGSGLGSAGAGVLASSIANTGISFGAIPNALGGVYDSPSLSRYINQIHDSPKLFTFAKGAAPNVGMFAEAGEEAIMPLKRGPDGNLGVRAAMMPPKAGPTIVLNPTINIDSGTDKAEIQALVLKAMDMAVKQAKSQLIDEMSRGMA